MQLVDGPSATLPGVLRPWIPEEALTVAQAARHAKRSKPTVREWIRQHGIGRDVAGTVFVSLPALAMHMERDRHALSLYLAGDRLSASVRTYFERFEIPTQPKYPRKRKFEKSKGSEKSENPVMVR